MKITVDKKAFRCGEFPFPLKAPDDIWLKTDRVENSSGFTYKT